MGETGRRESSCEPRYCTKEYGFGRKEMNSLALFIYNKGYPEKQDPVSAYNEWIHFYGKRPPEMESALNALEHARKLLKLDREELRMALVRDRLIPRGEKGGENLCQH